VRLRLAGFPDDEWQTILAFARMMDEVSPETLGRLRSISDADFLRLVSERSNPDPT